MKKKKIFAILTVLVVAVCAIALAGCNAYEWKTIGGGNSGANVESNGGTVVKQGNHLYFINGFQSAENINNEFGAVYKQGIARATLKDGKVDQSSYELIVPKHIYSASTKSGIAIFGEWIYYASPNQDKNDAGTPSTTRLDFMRSKIDGSITQKIYTVSKRDIEYKFTPSAVLYYDSNTIYSVDFSGMKTNKSIDNGSGASKKTLVSGIDSYFWGYSDVYQNGKNSVSNYVYYTKSISDKNVSYRFVNTLNRIKYDGSGYKKLAGVGTYDHDLKIALVNGKVENNNQVNLYYTKTKSVNGSSVVEGTFVNKVAIDGKWDIKSEKTISNISRTSIYPISYDKGCLVTDGEKIMYNNYTDSKEVVNKASVTIRNVDIEVVNDKEVAYLYYTDSGTPSEMVRINVYGEGDSPNRTTVFNIGKMKVDWTPIEFMDINGKSNAIFFNADDYNYLNGVVISDFKGDIIEKGYLLGSMTNKDKQAKIDAKKAEKEKELEKNY